MSIAGGSTAAAGSGWRSLPLVTRNLIAIVGMTAAAIVWQTRWGTVPDTSWLITVCERVLVGELLYVDIQETNPPFSVWLYVIPVALARLIGIAPELVVHAWTYLAAIIGLLAAGLVVVKARFAETQALIARAPAFYALLVIFPGNAFSEREHFGVAFFMPMLVLMAWRAQPDLPARPGFGLALAVGAMASVLLLVKPYYYVMVLVPILWICVRGHSLRPLVAPEHWAIAFVCCAYLATTLTMYPTFLSEIYPVLADVYQPVRVLFPTLKLFGPAWLLLILLACRMWPVGWTGALASVLVIASAAAWIPLLWQGKGWAYHAYPAIFCAVAALVCLHPTHPRQRLGAQREMSSWPLINATGMVFVGAMTAFIPFWHSQKPSTDIVAAIRNTVDRPSIALIGSDIALGHPLTRMVGGHWASIHVSDWLGASALYLSMRATLDGEPERARHYSAIVDRYATAKREELLAFRPEIIVFQKDEKPWIRRLMEEHDFEAILRSYKRLARGRRVDIYVREDTAEPSQPSAMPHYSPGASSG